ncbi:hypothetical protein AKJ47_01070 [candidate division MSBL1 archaeon SCGC-AAA261G05]|uniref:PIN domain-containing protein n=2 Tax=candidate division MSBL1 TaxID=215777 RepID=A0A133V297_9EURY|nr:hypothetical protein AKJ42_00360 [candidate division MSBL1 archaeon SCGC-AAA261C02]KXB04024.1 hypothetical protein AKJ47_01070 [candidate division MSBL1 archaeon SCGC-AAA261G05]
MPAVDTEALFAFNPKDSKHEQVIELLKRQSDVIAPDTALLEFQIVVRNRRRKATEVRKAMLALREALARYEVKEASTLTSSVLVHQCELEEEYELSYFDSLVAASALALDQKIISDDEAFDRIPDLERVPLSKS